MPEILRILLEFALCFFMILFIPFCGIVLADIIDTINWRVLVKKIKKIPPNMKELWCSLFEDGE